MQPQELLLLGVGSCGHLINSFSNDFLPSQDSVPNSSNNLNWTKQGCQSSWRGTGCSMIFKNSFCGYWRRQKPPPTVRNDSDSMLQTLHQKGSVQWFCWEHSKGIQNRNLKPGAMEQCTLSPDSATKFCSEILEVDNRSWSPFSPNSITHIQPPQFWPYSCTTTSYFSLKSTQNTQIQPNSASTSGNSKSTQVTHPSQRQVDELTGTRTWVSWPRANLLWTKISYPHGQGHWASLTSP